MKIWKETVPLLLLLACGSPQARTAPEPAGGTGSSVVYNGGLTGAAAPQLAVEQFLAAAHAGDLQAMSAVWGTDKGPARDNMDRSELEKREIILQCFFNADAYRVLGVSPGKDNHQVVRAELTKGSIRREPNFFVILGPGNRWYVDNMEIAVVRDFCGAPSRDSTH